MMRAPVKQAVTAHDQWVSIRMKSFSNKIKGSSTMEIAVIAIRYRYREEILCFR